MGPRRLQLSIVSGHGGADQRRGPWPASESEKKAHLLFQIQMGIYHDCGAKQILLLVIRPDITAED